MRTLRGWRRRFWLRRRFQPEPAGLAAEEAPQRVGNPVIHFHRSAGDVKLVNLIRGAVKTGDKDGPDIRVLKSQLDKKAGKEEPEKAVFPQMNQFIAERKPQRREGGAFDRRKNENQKRVAKGCEPKRKRFFHRREYRE